MYPIVESVKASTGGGKERQTQAYRLEGRRVGSVKTKPATLQDLNPFEKWCISDPALHFPHPYRPLLH